MNTKTLLLIGVVIAFPATHIIWGSTMASQGHWNLLGKSSVFSTLLAGSGAGTGAGSKTSTGNTGTSKGPDSGKVQKPADSGKSDGKSNDTITPSESDTAQAIRG